MPKGNKNLIQSLRSAHDPHFKLEGRVEELEKKLPIQIADLHKTLSKSFGMQRKTLVRVLALEKKIEELKAAKEKVEEVVKDIGEDKIKEVVDDIKEEKTPEEKAPQEETTTQEETASEEEIPEGLDDVLDDIRGEKEESGTETKKPAATKKKAKKKPRKKPTARKIPTKKPVAKKKKISAESLKKGTVMDPDFKSRVMGEDEKGEYLSPEERKIRFKKSKISSDNIRGTKPVDPPPELPAGKDDKEAETEGLKGIRDVLDDILKVLRLDFKGDRKEAREDQKVAAQDKREKREGKLEGGGGIKKSVGLIGKGLKAVVSPFTSIWESVIKFIKFTIIGVLFNKAMKWFNNPKNEEKAKRIGKFFKDWWPTLATAAALFLTPLGGLVKGVVGLLTAIIPKIVMAIAANPFAALALVGTGLAIWGISKMANKKENNEGGGEVDEGETTQSMSGGGLVKSSPSVIDAPKSAQNFVQKFNGGGLVQYFEEGGSPQEIEEEDTTTKKQWTTEDIVAATGPSLMIFMEEQNAAVDADPEAWGGIKLKLDRDGKMPNFGEFIMNQGEAEFNKGLEMLQNNESVEPEVKEALLKKALLIRSQTLEDPNFKADVAFDINKDIPGTAANRLFMKAQADTTSPAAMAGLSAHDRALAMNRRGYNKGGKVPGSGNKDTVPAMLTPGEFVMSKGAVNKYGMDTLENMNAAAGSGSSSKKKDTVSSMLTPGEFVVSAPAVQKYGVDTLESMNLKGGGNNKPEIKVGANKGGLINNYNNIVSQYQGGGVVGEEDSRVIIDIIKKTTNNNMDPVDVPVPAAKNTTITLPTIPKNKPEETTTSQNDIPKFRVSMISTQRSMVISSLGISDLVGG